MPAKGYKKYNVLKKTYNCSMRYDDSIPDEALFQTAISLTKKTYVQIDIIKNATNNKSRSTIIATAIQHYLDYISSPQYYEDMRKKLNTAGEYNG